jgi:hypothetical protein
MLFSFFVPASGWFLLLVQSGHFPAVGAAQRAHSFEDCGAQTEPGQTERFYHADKGLLSVVIFVIMGRF